MCGFLPLIAIVTNWVCGVVKDLMTTMLTANFVIICEFLCDNSGKAQILQYARKAKHVQGPVARGMISA